MLLALEPNNKRIEGKSLETVIIRSFPNALAMLGPVLAIMLTENFSSISVAARNSMAMSALLVASFINLVALCKPFSKWRAAVVTTIGLLIGIAVPVSIFALDDMLHFKPVGENVYMFLILLAATIVFTLVMQFFRGKILFKLSVSRESTGFYQFRLFRAYTQLFHFFFLSFFYF